MFRSRIVIWLVLLVLALDVVVFVTRMIEKCRLHTASKEHKNRLCRTDRWTNDMEASTEAADTRLGIVCFTW